VSDPFNRPPWDVPDSGDLTDTPPPAGYRRIRVLIEVESYRLEGMLTLPPPEGYRKRLSDYLNYREGDFLPITDVTVSVLGGDGPSWQLPFAMVARSHIRLIAPLDPA